VGKSHPMSTTNLLHSTTYKKYVVITRLCSWRIPPTNLILLCINNYLKCIKGFMFKY
jgi:hypothetical protein